jgi:transcriptional regulator with XRE-family HTH domain
MASPETKEKLRQIGLRLRKTRMERKISLSQFALQMGLSLSTLRRMESGYSGIALGRWADLLHRLGRISDLDAILEVPRD